MKHTNETPKRLESLDILRGFDLFFLVLFSSVIGKFAGAAQSPALDSFMWNFSHVEWEGFSPWDLVMPLFMFMAGVSMPFSLNKYRGTGNKNTAVYQRIFKRFFLLWIFGMISQGNLLGLDPDRLFLFSNTLQSIAIGYLVTALLYIHVPTKALIAYAIASLLLFWGAMEFITIDGYGGGNYTPDGNLAEWVDRAVLGRFRDGSSMENGVVVFSESYRYTWVLSSVNFIVTVMSGLFAGLIIRQNTSHMQKIRSLLWIGLAMIALGWLGHMAHPVIKKIWSSTMTLISSGYCFLLMGVFYYAIDYKGWSKGFAWLKILGMNSIAVYMMAQVVNFRGMCHSLLYGLEQYAGDFYPVLLECGQSACLFLILYWMYRQKIFLRV